MIKKLIWYIKKPIRIVFYLDNKGIIKLNDKLYLKLMFKYRFGKKLDLNNPQTFNEKLQWLKLNDRKNKYIEMVDKYEVKNYVSRIIGNKYIIPTIGVYSKFEDINFEELPNSFVIKTTHDSGGIAICKDKSTFDIAQSKKTINSSLHYNYFYSGREWPYKGVKPRIIIERYMEDENTKNIRDYKFFCFNGEAKIFKIDFDRFVEHHANYYDLNGNILPFGEKNYPPKYDKQINMPVNLKEMIKYANLLSKNIPFVRIDFYEINKKLYFGEITFYPASGLCEFTDYGWDLKLGNWIMFPKEINDEK